MKVLNVIAIVSITLVAATAKAQQRFFDVVAETSSSVIVYNQVYSVNGASGGASDDVIALFPAGNWRYIWIAPNAISHPDPTVVDLPRIQLVQDHSAPRTNQVTIFMSSYQTFAARKGRDFRGTQRFPLSSPNEPFGGAYNVYAYISRNLTGDIPDAQGVLIDASGDIQASINQIPAPSGSSVSTQQDLSVTAHNFGSGTTMACTQGKIALLATTSSGNMTCSSITTNSSIVAISCAGSLGPSSGTATITAPKINQLTAVGFVHANVTTTGTVTTAADAMQLFKCANYTGTLSLKRVEKLSTQTGWTNALEVASGVSGSISLGDVASPIALPAISGSVPVTAKSVTSAGSITIAGTLSGLLQVTDSVAGGLTFGTSTVPGLAGQVIVNAGGSASGVTWGGTTRINGSAGTILATIPEYANLSAAIGGGAVGLAPFALHDEDCVPSNAGSPVTVAPWQLAQPTWAFDLRSATYPDPQRLRTRFYGPVYRVTGTGCAEQGVTVEYNSSGTWVDVSGDFTITAPTSATLTGDPRDLFLTLTVDQISGSPLPDGQYRVRDNQTANSGRTSRLKCAYVTGNPNVKPFVRSFNLNKQCSPVDVGIQGGTFGYDGVLDNNDFVSYISLFFANDPAADLGKQGGIVGPDGMWDNNDFVVQIDFYFDGTQNSHSTCSIGDDGAIEVPTPSPVVVNDPVIDRELTALWNFLERTGDERVAARFVDTLFGGQ